MFLGIEIGGTKLQLGLGRGDGELLGMWRGTVDENAGGEGIRREIAAAIPKLLASSGSDRAALRGVGVGFGGPVDDATQTIVTSHQIDGWDEFPLADWLTDLTSLPAVVCNDADVAGLAEALFGAGKGLSPIFYVTVGSGIGGGLIIDGNIYRGVGRGAAEIGHLRIADPRGGADASILPLESYSSGWGIAAAAGARERTGEDVAGVRRHAGDGPFTARAVAAAAAEWDEVALQILDTAWQALAEGICHVIALLCPKRIVIGGGVSLMGEQLFFEPLRHHVASRVFKPFAGLTDIVPAALGEEVVVHGALALARKRLGG
jgi:glucokinase